jgi:SAM-dependent methyltransferase
MALAHPSLTRAARQFRRHRVLGPLVSAIGRVRRALPAWSTVTFFVRPLDDEDEGAGTTPAQRARPVDGIRAEEVSASALDWLMDGADPDQPIDALAERFERGDRCVVAIDRDGRAAHVRWLTTHRTFVPELGRDVVLDRGQAYFYNGYTRPDMRGRGLDGLVRTFIFDTLRREGVREAWSYVRGDNPAGWRAAARWQQPAGTSRFVQVLGRPVATWWTRGTPPPLRFERPASRIGSGGPEPAGVWKTWFESWVDKPLEQRSTGWSALPDEYFAATANFLASTLRLDAERDRVLDVGCDSAMVSRLVVPRCRQLTGVDFVPGMLADGRRLTAGLAAFLAADGRRLPFAPKTFGKAYCTGVVHVMPSQADGIALIREMIRVCEPGGTVLVAAVPDVRKRWTARLDVWKRAGLAGKVCLPIWVALPRWVRRPLKAWLGRSDAGPAIYLDYDLRRLKDELDAEGLTCTILDYPDDYWSSDFRRTRSNLLIRIPSHAGHRPAA